MGKKEILLMSVFQLICMIVIVPLNCIQVKEKVLEKLMVSSLLIYVLLIQYLHNYLCSRLLRYFATVILQIALVYVSLYAKNHLSCLAIVTFVK